MPRTIDMKRAARVAGVRQSDMRDIADKNALRIDGGFIGEALDEGKFLGWLEAYEGKRHRAAEEYEEEKYQSWLLENGDFLRRFLREEAGDQ